MKHFAACRLSLALATVTAMASVASGQGRVFAMTNSATGNEVVAYMRNPQGQLAPLNTFPTGATGTGIWLGSQGALVLSPDRQWLLAVNAGSNSISVFHVLASGLVLTDVEPSGATQPVSVTTRGGLAYVLHAGVPNSVNGFQLSSTGDLTPIPGVVHALTASSTTPAQVEITPTGASLVVTERATDKVDTFRIMPNGALHDFVPHFSSGIEPFGFAFYASDRLIVAEGFAGVADASAVSSYRLDGSNLIHLNNSVPSTETGGRCTAVTRGGRYAYVSNRGSDSISGYLVSTTGQLSLLDAGGVTAVTGDAPTDMAFSSRSRYLYVLNSLAGTISGYERMIDGSLIPIQAPVGALPLGATGVAAF